MARIASLTPRAAARAGRLYEGVLLGHLQARVRVRVRVRVRLGLG